MTTSDLRSGAIDHYGWIYEEAKAIGFAAIAARTGIPEKTVQHMTRYPQKAPGGPLGNIERACLDIASEKLVYASLDNAGDTGPLVAFNAAFGLPESHAVGDYTDDQLVGVFIMSRTRGWDDIRDDAAREIDRRAGAGTAEKLTEWLERDCDDQTLEMFTRMRKRHGVKTNGNG